VETEIGPLATIHLYHWLSEGLPDKALKAFAGGRPAEGPGVV
jgi:hypothetical protein